MAARNKDEAKQPGFTVSDRRTFSESGEPKAEADQAAGPAAAAPQDAPATSQDAPAVGAGSGTGRALPPVDFHTFILSLGSSALLHLGELDAPDGQEARPDLPLAKHTIDVLVMLQEKTKGNLSPPEERLMDSLLYDLRLRFVERSKKSTA